MRTVLACPTTCVAGAVAMTVPQSEMFPEELHGQFVTALLLGYLGSDEDAAKQAFAPFDAAPEPLLAMGMTVPFAVAQTMQDDDMPSGRQNYWKAGNLRELTEERHRGASPPTHRPCCHLMAR